MAKEALETISAAEKQADAIRSEALARSAEMTQDMAADCEKRLSDGENAAMQRKAEVLRDINAKAEALIAQKTAEAELDAGKIKVHADKMQNQAIAYIIGSISGKKN